MGTSMHPRAGIKAALVTAAVGLLICTPATADAAEPGALGVPGDVVDVPLRSALQALDVQEEVRAGYERSRFRH
ncbi:hypothetical protein [Streptomyces clavifer]|uniref:hypothetical protein n=1 Tax=Streptomyces clavifer TaxID=68188 RepID=UPI003651C640